MEFLFENQLPFSEKFDRVLSIQLEKNRVYSRFVSSFDGNGHTFSSDNIPLLPIRAFKDARLLVDGADEELQFKSSSTGSAGRSTHFIADIGLYRNAFRTEFYRHFPENRYSILAYTPGYKENPDSSLIWMLNDLIQNDPDGLSRFLPLNMPLDEDHYQEVLNAGKHVILFGAAFGLLDLIEMNSPQLPEKAIIIETGGMKTHRREMSKTELRQELSEGFGVPQAYIHSEYGMCELMSQCYAIGSEWFRPPAWVKVILKDPQNPIRNCDPGEEGKIGIIDLANVYSCPFILTDDRGIMNEKGEFRVLGRWHQEDLRGCNFLIDRD